MATGSIQGLSRSLLSAGQTQSAYDGGKSRFTAPSEYRDPVWAILFLVHLLFMVVLSIIHGNGLKLETIFQDSEAQTFWVSLHAASSCV